MQFVADLHLHSKYSRAVSPNMVLPEMEKWAVKKGIDVLTVADFTHPLWFRELKAQLVEAEEGLFKLKSEIRNPKSESIRFVLSTEISSIYSQGGKTRRIHNLVFMPSLESVEKFNTELIKRGCNLSADGRPIIGLSSRNLLDLVLTIDPKSFLIPCHAWTPWFSLYGSFSGFDSIEECFQDLSKEIYGVETGLSSDPEMNWRIKDLDNRSILSFSDAHSAIKMGREATVFELEKPTFENIRKAIKYPVISSQLLASLSASDRPSRDGSRSGSVVGSKSSSFQLTGQPITDKQASENRKQKTDNRIAYTIEFYPEEGKYHYTGHRNCKVTQTPEQTKQNGVICPVCKRGLTVGVLHRVEQLTGKPKTDQQKTENRKQKTDNWGVKWIYDPRNIHPPYVKLVPLIEIIAESVGVMPGSLKVLAKFDEMVLAFGSELNVLIRTSISDIEKQFGEKIAQGIDKVRRQDIYVEPGFDGEYGKVKIWGDEVEEKVSKVPKVSEEQMGLF